MNPCVNVKVQQIFDCFYYFGQVILVNLLTYRQVEIVSNYHFANF